jgi:hypothetical protein
LTIFVEKYLHISFPGAIQRPLIPVQEKEKEGREKFVAVDR